MSVLAHVVRGGPQQNEPAATQALTYILNKSPKLVRSLIDLIRTERLQFEPGRVDAEQGIEDGQPDLTIYDQAGRLRVFVENKFWAGLTEAQPVVYLRKLSNEYSSALIFIVPAQRVPTVWDELKDRCDEDRFEWDAEPSEGSELRQASVDRKLLMVVSWKLVLKQLLDVANSEGMDAVAKDILQLRGLTDSMNLEAFLPLHDDETNNQELPSRLINYIDLITDIIRGLKNIDKADTNGLAFSSSTYATGHFLRIHSGEKFDAWLGHHLKRWRDVGISPLWCRIRGHRLNVNHFRTIPTVFNYARQEGNNVWIPIRLLTGVERAKVVECAVTQIERIANEVLSEIPD